MAKPLSPPENLLSVLPPELAAPLFATARTQRLRADQTLFTAGDPGDGCYRVEQGLLKVSVVSPSGSERILAILGPGALVGELAMIDAQPRSASVVAARDSELSFISRSAFEAIAKTHPDIYRHIVKLLAQRLRDTNMVVAAMSFLSLKGRVAQALLSLAEAFGNDVGSGPYPGPAEGHAERSGRHGGHRAREREPHPQRMDAPEIAEPACGLLLPGGSRGARTRSRDVITRLLLRVQASR
jgi:CRP/FNR family cyclic AMP-dependent transcriptional regulator